MVKRIYLILMLALILSCSDKSELLTDKYWVKYKRNQPNHIVKFERNAKFINYNKLEKNYKYAIIQNRLIITDAKGEKKKYFIKKINDNELKLAEIVEVGDPSIDYYRKAKFPDYFLGEWIYSKNNLFTEFDFSGDLFVKITETKSDKIERKKLRYSVKNDSIIQIGNKKYKFTFTNDLLKLNLKSESGEILRLNRK